MDNRQNRIRGVSEAVQLAAWQLRDNMTPAEERLWDALRGRKLGGLKFRRQHAIGRFVLDFYCSELRLGIELDGSIHDQLVERDLERTELLSRYGYRIIRFTNDQVLDNLSGVLEHIRSYSATPAPPELGDGGAMTIAIIDFGMGNLRSVEKALHYVGASGAFVTDDPHQIAAADKAVLPGDGAFDATMDNLRAAGIDNIVKEFVATGRPFLGICIGMQAMLSRSEEGRQGVAGLNLVPGSVQRFPPFTEDKEKLPVPQIGWNKLRVHGSSRLLHGLNPADSWVYCLHSYFCVPDDSACVVGTVEYGLEYCAAVESGNIFATQFHPEKSGGTGLHILRNFALL